MRQAGEVEGGREYTYLSMTVYPGVSCGEKSAYSGEIDRTAS